MKQRTLLIIKPDGVARGLSEEVFLRLKNKGFKFLKKKKFHLSEEKARELYEVHKGKHFYEGLVKFITSGPIFASVAEREDAVVKLREIMGATDPKAALPGTIRGDLKEENILTDYGIIKNIVHGSDSLENAQKEIKIIFGEEV